MGLSCREIVCHRQTWNQGHPSAVLGVTLKFFPGEVCGIVGHDGCGKGLLLNILGLLETPDSGDVRVGNCDPAGLELAPLTELRNRVFGFLFSQAGLLPAFSVAENVAMPLFRICGNDPETAQDRTLEVLDFCGIADDGNQLAGRLDASCLWRAAFARAVIHHPEILIAISPKNEDELLPLARRVAEDSGMAVLWAGGRVPLSRFAHRLITMNEGKITEDVRL